MYGEPSDLVLMQDLVGHAWRTERPFVNCTAGDLEWWFVNDPAIAREDVIRLWFDDASGDLVGWAFLEPPASLDWHVRVDHRGGPVSEEMLDWLEERAARAPVVAGTTSPEATVTWAMDADEPTRALLARRGYGPTDRTMTHWIRSLPAGGGPPLPDPAAFLPDGYRIRSMRWPEDLEARVEVHRSAFAPSSMTVEKLGTLASWSHYAPDRDWVVVAPDGSFAAFANAWWDPDGRIGELEPVGTHADHRRRGLARAACFAALSRLAELGAPEVLVFSETANAASEGLYASLGARAVTHARRWSRPLAR